MARKRGTERNPIDAPQAFDEIETDPNMVKLWRAYQKKFSYAAYRKAREDMKELLTVKANIDRILAPDKKRARINAAKKRRSSVPKVCPAGAACEGTSMKRAGFRVNGSRLFLQNGYRFALLAGFLFLFVTPSEAGGVLCL